MEGGPATGVSVLLAPLVVLGCPPAGLMTVLVTRTVMVQLPLAARLPPVRVMAPLPAVAVSVPPQLLVVLNFVEAEDQAS